MIIRRGSLKDLNELTKLLYEYDLYENNLDKNVNVDSLKKIKEDVFNHFKRKTVFYTIAEEDHKIIGLINWSVSNLGYEKNGKLHNIIISKIYRNKGAGARLVKAVLGEFKSKGCKYVGSFVRNKNKKAQIFWKKQGFDFAPGVNISKKLK